METIPGWKDSKLKIENLRKKRSLPVIGSEGRSGKSREEIGKFRVWG